MTKKKLIPLIFFFLLLGASATFLLVKKLSGNGINVILITIDTLRQDHTSIYNDKIYTTPNLELLSKEGAKFLQAYAPTGVTAPSHATLFTSQYPISHGLQSNRVTLNKNRTTLAEHLSKNGYQTAAIVSSFVLKSRFGLAKGFKYYEDDFPIEGSTVPKLERWRKFKDLKGFDQRADKTTQKAIHWLKKKRKTGQPFFLFIHYFDPHRPYDPPKPFKGQLSSRREKGISKEIGLYDEEILSTDHQIGLFLKTLSEMGLNKKTIVVITSDHGEGLMSHGIMGHGVYTYEEIVLVPLLFSWPGRILPDTVIKEPVGLIDLGPTILSLIGLPIPKSFYGLDLSRSLLMRAPLPQNRPLFFQRGYPRKKVKMASKYGEGHQFGVRMGKWKYFVGWGEKTEQLFNLQTDPGEKINVHQKYSELSKFLAMKIETWKKSFLRSPSTSKKLSNEDVEALKALGYLN